MGKADNLLNKISEYQRELKKLQSECNHTKKDIRFIDYQRGVRYVCRDCKVLLGWPSKEEIYKWSNK
jgi:predicted SprT family Zn-dependent metalloprotease|tara:strand:+ start:1034 stop:1234 length:201 start_codon:yes stop_codon:yes gene_type:complete